MCAAALVAAALIAGTLGAAAQTRDEQDGGAQGGGTQAGRLLLGPAAAYGFGVPLWMVRGAGTVNGLPAGGTGTSTANAAALEGLMLWDGPFGPDLSLQAGLGLRYTTENFRSGAYAGDLTIDPASGAVVPALSETRALLRVASLSAELRAELPLTEGVSLSAGLWGEFRLASSAEYTIRRLSPLPVGFAPFDSAVVPPAGAQEAHAARLGPAISLARAFPLSRGLLLRPEMDLRVDAGALFDGLGPRSASIGLRAALLFDLSAAPDTARPDTARPPTAPPDTVRRDTVRGDTAQRIARDTIPAAPVVPALSAAIDLCALGPDGTVYQTATVHADLVRNIVRIPFPTSIYIDRGAGLDACDSAIGVGRADSFSLEGTAGVDPRTVAAHAIDLIGGRLRAAVRDTLLLRVPEGEDAPFATERAGWIRGYLSEAWGVDSARVRIVTVGGGDGSGAEGSNTDRSGNDRSGSDRSDDPRAGERPRRLGVAFAGARASAPLVLEWRSLAYTLPKLDIRPEIHAAAGVLNWAIAVRQGTQVVTEYSSGHGPEESSGTLYIPEARTGRPLEPLVAELAARDSAGATVLVYDTLRLAFDSPRPTEWGDSAVPERERRIYHLRITGRGNGAVAEAVRDLTATLRPGDRVTTRGPRADRICDAIRMAAPAKARTVTFRTDDAYDRTPIHSAAERAFAGWDAVVIERAAARTASNDKR